MENKKHVQVLEGSTLLFEFNTDMVVDHNYIRYVLTDLNDKRESGFYKIILKDNGMTKEYRINTVDGELMEKIIS
jgi:zona occludens toxin (predicted ATPase)